jgi:ParB family chromosome partitioning protein
MAAKRRTAAEMLEVATNTGAAIQAQDRAVEARAEVAPSPQSSRPLGKILERKSDTRDLREQHVTDLAESIAVLRLLEPLVVDIRGRMLAGGHRKAAIELLKECDPSVYTKLFPNEQVPVRIMGFDAEAEPDLALQVEVAENEKRRDYTVSEARALAERLRVAGYVDVKGRPAKGEKALRPALEVIMGKSLRTVRRYLNEESTESVTPDLLSEQEETKASIASLRRLRTELVRWQKLHLESSPQLQAVERDVVRLLKQIEAAMKKMKA